MDVFDLAITKVREMKESTIPELEKTFDGNIDVVINYNTEKQLFDKGETAAGSKIVPSYTALTKRIKRRKRQPINRVTLKDKGNFYKSVKVSVFKDRIEFSSSIAYSKYLFKKYGSDVLGVQQQFMEEFIEKFYIPNLISKYASITNS